MSQTLAPALVDHGSVGAGTTTPEIGKGLYHRITCTASTRTIAAPLLGIAESPGPPPDLMVNVPVAGRLNVGTVLFVEIRNSSGGAVTVTWNAAWKGAPGNPANGQKKLHVFIFDGVNFCLTNVAPDVAVA